MKKTTKKILFLLLNLISKTWKFKLNGEFPVEPCILAFWHGEMLPVWKFFAKHFSQKFAIVSLSKDGQILSELLEQWGYSLIRGSSSKKGHEVLEKAQKVAHNSVLFITPDGPRGPFRKFKSGAAVISYRTNVPIYLIRAKTKKKIVFRRSWDKFELPLPFSKINLNISPKITISPKASREEINEYIIELNNILNSLV